MIGGPRPRWSARPRPVTERVGGIKGMRSTLAGQPEPGFVEWLHNCYPADPYVGGEIVARPGRQPYPPFTIGPNQVGTIDGATRQTQLLTPFGAGGLTYTVAIVGSKFYSDKGGLGFVEAVNAATFTSAGITLTAQTYYACQFNGKLIICGTEVAFSWDGTANGGITKLTNAGTSFYGKPVVYAAKVFFIRGSQQTIVWSEEGDETTGYEVGHTNAWDLRQTSREPIIALLATNLALIFFRRGSIGAIYGGEATAFQTTATLDAVSATIGTDTPESPILVGDTVWFITQQGRPACFTLGSTTILPIWTELERAFTPYFQDGQGYAGLAAPNSEQATFVLYGSGNQSVHCRSLDLVFFTYRYFASSQADGSAMDVLVGFHSQTKRLQTVWSFPTGLMKIIENYDLYYSSGEYALVLTDLFGYVYTINVATLLSFNHFDWFIDKDLHGGDANVTASVSGPRHFGSVAQDLRVRRLDLDYVGFEPGGSIAIRWATPEINVGGGVRFVDDRPLGTVEPGHEPVILPLDGAGRPLVAASATVGFNEMCRWIAFGFSWVAQSTRIRLGGWQVTAEPVGTKGRAKVF